MTLLKSYNVPELTTDKINIMPDTFKKIIYQVQAESVTYH